MVPNSLPSRKDIAKYNLTNNRKRLFHESEILKKSLFRETVQSLTYKLNYSIKMVVFKRF